MELKKNTCCSYCGFRFVEQVKWPRQCGNCNMESYSNPLPVVITLLILAQDNKRGLIIQQRGIAPEVGGWALTGGYMNEGESWQEAISREVFEELGFETSPEDFQLLEVVHSINKEQVLIMSLCTKYVTSMEEVPFVPNQEVIDLQVIYEPMTLAFPTHSDLVNKFFATKSTIALETP